MQKNSFKIWKTCKEYTIICREEFSLCGNCVLALGNFDGVHIAHKKLIEGCISLKGSVGADSAGAFCFSNNPLTYMSDDPPTYLTGWREKATLLLETGLDFVIVADFPSFRDIEWREFAEVYLRHTFNCTGVCCGFNFRFGKGGEGSAAMLVSIYGEKNSFVLGKTSVDDIPVSSTAIRKYISEGKMEDAAAMLGRNYSVDSTVRKGKKLGRTIGFPTINQTFFAGMTVPLFGIYAVRCTLPDGSVHTGVANVGIRPTVPDSIDLHEVNCETYIHSFKGDLYGQTVRTEFCHLLRREKRFNSIEELTSAIAADSESALSYFKENK